MALIKVSKTEKSLLGLANTVKTLQPPKATTKSEVIVWAIGSYVLSLALFLTNDIDLSYEHASSAFFWLEKLPEDAKPNAEQPGEAILNSPTFENDDSDELLLKCELRVLIADICKVDNLVIIEAW